VRRPEHRQAAPRLAQFKSHRLSPETQETLDRNMNEPIDFDRAKLVSLKRAYHRAKLEEKETFVFEGKDFLVDFAKYLIEYLEKQLK
jgi:hypothetical protein